MAGIRNSQAKPPVKKEAVMTEDLIAMVETLDRDSLRGLRDRGAMLLIGIASAACGAEIVGVDLKADQTEDGRGWLEILDKSMLIALRGKTGWRGVEVGRGSPDATCPVAAIETWIKFARLGSWPPVTPGDGARKAVGSERFNDKEVARIMKRAAIAAGAGSDFSEIERSLKFSLPFPARWLGLFRRGR